MGKSKYFSLFVNWYILQISAGSLDAEHLLASVIKILSATVENNLKDFIRFRGLSRDSYWRGDLQEIRNDIPFGSEVLLGFYGRHQKLDYMGSSYP